MTHTQTITLVTGANQGIGYQIVKELAAKGHQVWLGSRSLERGETAAKSLEGDIHVIQLDVTDQASITAAAKRIEQEAGHLDILINNAAISNTRATEGMSLQEYTQISRASNIPLEEVRAIWETNVFGVLALTQALLPLLRKSSAAQIINVSSGVGSLALNADPNGPFRAIFSPGYAASKTALNAITLAFAIELEAEGIKVNAVTPGFTKTNLNNYEGTETLEEGAAEAVRLALLGKEAPTGGFTHAQMGTVPW